MEPVDLQPDPFYMQAALRLARKAYAQGEVPVGAVVVRHGEIIGRGWNQVEQLKDATAHAEMIAITAAESAVDDWRLNDCELYVTKEPCPMCAGAIVHVRLARVIYGCADPRGGATGGFMNLLDQPTLNHRCPVLGGVLGDECGDLIRQFFRERRALPDG